jgi:hypothetical protein
MRHRCPQKGRKAVLVRNMNKNKEQIGRIAEIAFSQNQRTTRYLRARRPVAFSRHILSLLIVIFLAIPAISQAASATITWKRNQEPDIAGYRIYYGTQDGRYTNSLTIADSANDLMERSYEVGGLSDGITYFFALKAFDQAGQESGYSQTVSLMTSSSGVHVVDLYLETYFPDAPASQSRLYPRVAGDVNGDSLDDFIVFASDGTYVALSNGGGFEAPSMWIADFAYRAGGWTSQDKYPRTTGDANGDGLTDIIGFGTDGTYVALSNGDAFGSPSIWTTDYAYAAGWISEEQSPRIVLDLNANDKADVVGVLGDETHLYIN